MTFQNSSTTLLRPFLVALLAAACLAATHSQFTIIPVDDPASVQQLRDSIAELTKRLEKTPGDTPTRIELAGAYSQLAEFDSAERELTTATTNAPNNAQAWAALGSFKGAQQKWPQAIEPLQKAVALGNTDGNTFFFLGTAYQRTQDQINALDNYNLAIEHGCNAALLSRSWLHHLMGSAPLAIEDLNKAIELKVNPPEAYLQRGHIYSWLQDINKALADYSSAIDADPKSFAAYVARARLRDDTIGDFHGAVDDFTHAIDINPQSPAAYGARGVTYIEHRDYDKGIADIKEAIRLNPQDLGQNFEANTDKALDAASLAHGEEQVRKMLADRPRMAEHVVQGDKLWNWAVRKFAGEDLGTPIDWDPSSPDPFASRSGEPTAGKHGLIELNLFQPTGGAKSDESDRPQQTFDELWGCAVYELYNVTSSPDWARLESEADSGKRTRDEYIQAMMRSEWNASERARAFYIQFFLPWLHSKDLNTTTPKHWFCGDFSDRDNLRSNYAFEGNSVYLSYYENTYDLKAAYLAGLRGDYAKAKEILTRILDHPEGLAAVQRSYARGLLAWTKQNSGDKQGAIEEFTTSLNEMTHLLTDDPKRAELLYSRAMAYHGLNRDDEAMADLNTAIELDPQLIEPRIARANTLARSGKYAEAKRDIDAAIVIDPESRAAFNLRAYIDYHAGDYAQAVGDITKAFDPQDPQILGMRGYALLRLKQYEKAIPDLDSLIVLHPTDANAHNWRAGARYFLKQYKDALADYDRAIELDPKFAPAYVNRSELLSETDDKEFRRPAQAMQDARRGGELTDWKEPEALRALASAYAATGDFASAIEWQEKALKMGGAEHRDEYSQLLAGYRKQVAATIPATSTQMRSCSACASKCCSEQRSHCRRCCGVLGGLRFFKR